MTTYEIYNLISYNKRIEDDIRVIEKATLDDLDCNNIEKYINEVRENKPNFSKIKDNNIALSKLGIISKYEDEYKPTCLGLLCFGICPELVLPQLVVKAMVVPGFNVGETGELGERFSDNKNITGTIPEIIKATMEFITKNMKKRTIITKDTGVKADKFEYLVEAIREAVINAIVHRDYSNYTESSYVSVIMFNDRIEISNPGGLYGNLTIDELSEVRNPPVRNKNLVRVLEEMGYIENRSSGIATMIMSMRELKLEPPIFKDEKGNFKVIFKNHTLMTNIDKEWIASLDTPMNENEAYALIFIRYNGVMTNGDYQKLNDVNRDKALQELKSLMKKRLIEVEGVGSGSYYILSRSINYFEGGAQDESTLTHTEQCIIKILESADCSKKTIAERLGHKSIPGSLKRTFEGLLQRGIIELTIPEKPNSKNQKYRLKT